MSKTIEELVSVPVLEIFLNTKKGLTSNNYNNGINNLRYLKNNYGIENTINIYNTLGFTYISILPRNILESLLSSINNINKETLNIASLSSKLIYIPNNTEEESKESSLFFNNNTYKFQDTTSGIQSKYYIKKNTTKKTNIKGGALLSFVLSPEPTNNTLLTNNETSSNTPYLWNNEKDVIREFQNKYKFMFDKFNVWNEQDDFKLRMALDNNMNENEIADKFGTNKKIINDRINFINRENFSVKTNRFFLGVL